MITLFASAGADLGLAMAAVIVFGVGAQLLASQIKVPSVLLLLAAGLAAGPGLGVIDTDELLGDLLFPLVSLAVGILLFEGGLGLRREELQKHGRGPIFRLITVGVLATWVIGGVGAATILGLDAQPAILLGAILTVSGPTVVIPLLRFARVREPVNGILRWEGIFIDPVGATLAIVVLDAVIENEGATASATRVLTTGAAGISAGVLGAGLLTYLFSKHVVPDNLHNPFTLAVVVAAFAGADLLRPEAGLFATTVMGVVLANQHYVPIAHIREFEEDLGQLILAGLFIILGARIDPDVLIDYLPESIAFTLLLIVVARPAAVWVSTIGSGLRSSERFYLMCMSPRGIVAASVSALFALELEEAGSPVEALVPVTFLVIVITVAFSAVAARVGAHKFRVARPAPNGVAFIGGPDWALDIAVALADREVPVIVVSTDPLESAAASRRGLLTYTGRLESEEYEHALESLGVGAAVAVSRFQELNSLGIIHATETVGRASVFYLPPTDDDEEKTAQISAVIGRRPFGRAATQASIQQAMQDGHEIVAISPVGFDKERLADAIPLFTISPEGVPAVETTTPTRPPLDGGVRLYLVPPAPDPIDEPDDAPDTGAEVDDDLDTEAEPAPADQAAGNPSA